MSKAKALAPAATALGLAALFALRAPDVFTEGRFWGEEGAEFYPSFLASPWTADLGYLLDGHLHLATNLAVLAASAAPLAWAPLVTTHAGFALGLLAPCLLAWRHRALGLAAWQVVLFAFATALLPASAEVLANATNAQFHLAAATCVVLALPTTGLGAAGRWALRALLALASVTGVPSAFWLPGFAWRAYAERDRERAVQAAVLAAGAVVQMALLALHGTERPLEQTLAVALGANALHLVAAPLLGVPAADVLGGLLRATIEGRSAAGIPVLAAGLAALAVFAAACLRRGTLVLHALLAGIAVSAVFAAVGALHPDNLLNGWSSARYFYVPALGMLLAIALLGARPAPARARAVGAALLAAVALAGASAWWRPAFFFDGPSWRAQLDAAPARTRLAIWPRGWVVVLPPHAGSS